MMLKVKLRNDAKCHLQNRAPGAEFEVNAIEPGVPADLYWRKRIADKSVSVVPEPAARPAAPAKPAAKKD